MSNISDKETDKLFKQAAEGYNVPFDEAMWSDMDTRLGANIGNQLSFYKVIGGTLAGIATVVALLIIFQSEQKNIDANNSINKVESIASNTPDPLINQQATEPNQVIKPNQRDSNKKPDQQSIIRTTTAESDKGTLQQTDGQTNRSSSAQWKKESNKKRHFNSPHLLQGLSPLLDVNHPLNERNLHLVALDEEPQKEVADFNPTFALSAVYAPDISSVGYFSPDKPGSGFGLMISYSFAKKWVVSTGALLSHKIYYSDNMNESYGAYAYPIDRLDAECKVIDIPINLSYYLHKSSNQGFYLTTGISSYLMLSEDYVFESEDYAGKRQWEQHYENDNNHLLGIVNLGIGYERKVTENFFFQLEPYLKAPIVGIGEGEVDLVSTGALINIKYQFKNKKK